MKRGFLIMSVTLVVILLQLLGCDTDDDVPPSDASVPADAFVCRPEFPTCPIGLDAAP